VALELPGIEELVEDGVIRELRAVTSEMPGPAPARSRRTTTEILWHPAARGEWSPHEEEP